MRSEPGPHRWLALVVLSLAQLMVVLDSTIVNIALPTAQRELAFSDDGRQWVVTGYALAFGSLLLIGGRLCDLYGRKRLFVVGMLGFAAASVLGGAAGGFGLLLIARVAQGAFAALLAPAALSMVSVTFADTIDSSGERGRAFGVFGAISGAGGALGLLLGGVLTQNLSWRWCLFVNVFIAVIAIAGALAFLVDGARPERMRLDLTGTVLAVLGLFGIVYGLGNAASRGWSDLWTLGPAAFGVLLLGAFVQVERRVRDPLMPLSVVLDRDRGASYLTIGISGTGGFAVFLFVTYYLAETLKFTPLQSGLAFLPMVALVMVGAVFSGAVLLPRIGPRPIVPAGSLLAATGMALLTGIDADSTYAGGVLPALLVIGLGLGMVFGPGQNAATSGVRPHETGVASAMANITQQVGGSIGLAVFSSLGATATAGYLAAHAATATDPATIAQATLGGYHLVFWAAAALFFAGAVLSAGLFRGGRLPVSPDAEPVLTH